MLKRLDPSPLHLKLSCPSLKRHTMHFPRFKLTIIATISVSVCILRISASAHLKQHPRGEAMQSLLSSSSVVQGPPILAEEIPLQSSSWTQTPLLRPHTQSPSLTFVTSPPTYSSENNHGHFRCHKRARISLHDDSNQQGIRKQQDFRVPMTLRPRDFPPFSSFTHPRPAAATSFLQASRRDLNPSYTREDYPIGTPGLVLLTLASLMLLHLEMYLGWIIVWRRLGST